MKRFSKFLSIMLILALMVPGLVFADSGQSQDVIDKALREKVIEQFKPILDEDKVPVDISLDEFFEEDAEVRIIVELESNPTIVYATEKNTSLANLSQSTIRNLERKILDEQQNVKDNILSKNINMEFFHSFSTAYNGFSGKVQFKDIELIESLPLVKKVYIANEYGKPEIKPEMNTSNDMIGALDIDYKGEGTVIAIIDTGIDPSHRDMVLSEGIEPKLTKEDIEGKDLLGKYYTDKVPYGYNYYDLNDEILDLGPGASMHGMHVAGTAGANGDVENGGIRGVAPESQLLAMKVFSNDPIYATTFTDIYLVAIDEAIKLGADVLNMSLGSTASFYIPESPEDVAITNATDNGIVCSVSAGNSAQMTDGWTETNYGFPWKENPDIGVVGSPGLNKDTIQVASIENTHTKARYLTYEGEDRDINVPMTTAGEIDPLEVFDEPQEFVDCGEGQIDEFVDIDVEGKIALMIRGGCTFYEKIMNAQNSGAVGVIVYNHEDGGEELINMAYPNSEEDGFGVIPAVFIGNNGGKALLELEEKFVTFYDGLMTTPNPAAENMSDFTSWGTTPSLELKPEITAPGGQIYSTLNDDQYGMMSGTSMAAPHVSGGSALVMEYIDKADKYNGLSDEEKARLAKVLLMNTAEIILDEYEAEVSPRRQGAGLMRLDRAVATPVRVVEYNTNEAKVALKDFEETSFTMKFNSINDTDEDVSYKVDTTVLKDCIYEGLNLLATDYINAEVTTNLENDILTVPADGEATFEVTVDFSEDIEVYRNMFVEGFVKLEETTDTHPDLSVPFVGFYGDWGEPKILDNMMFIDPEGTSYFNFSGMTLLTPEGKLYFYGAPIFMNPGTETGYKEGTDNIIPLPSFMRNAEVVNYNILDKDGKLLRTIYSEKYARKNYIDGGRRNPFSLKPNAQWDGTVNGKVVPDGEYFYEIAAKVHYSGAEMQSKKIPITIDTTGPEITDLEYDEETGKLTWNSVDEGIGIAGFMFAINDETLEDIVLGEEGKSSYEFDISQHIGDLGEYEITVISIDGLLNMDGATITYFAGDNKDPYIYIYEPMLLDVYTESDILFEGYVVNFHALDKVIIDDEVEADIEFVENVTLTHPDDPSEVIYTGPAYKFTKVVPMEDGYREVRVEAISKTGSLGSVVRRFYVDTTPPELEIELKEFNAEEMKADLEITMRDNLDYLRLMLSDSEIYSYGGSLVAAEPTEETIIYTVNLDEGDNIFLFTLYDTGEHEDIKKIRITEDGTIEFLDPEVDPSEPQPIENLPSNTVIVGDEAFDIRYLNNNKDAQAKLIEWYSQGNEIYIKLGKDRIVNIRGEIVGMDELPEELTYYDADGEVTKYVKN